ncbi:MAG: nicotinate-nucleotide adenylyltransferase [Patescibacteria group bacterium]
MKIGVLGGTFNPPHWGHFIITQAVFKNLGLDKILLIPSAIPSLKTKDLAPLKDRLMMTKLLAKLDSRLKVSLIEIQRAKRGKKSYTIDTIKELKRKFPKDEICWIIGADSFREIIEGKWRGGIALFDLLDFVVITRPGYNLTFSDYPLKLRKTAEKLLLKVKRIKLNVSISSTEIREKIKTNQEIRDLVPPNILEYIKKRKLYH